MNRIVGLIEVVEKEEVRQAVPSPVEIEYLWRKMEVDAAAVDKWLSSIRDTLYWFRRWSCKGLIKADDVDNAQEWHRIRFVVLKRLLERMIEETFVDGAGI